MNAKGETIFEKPSFREAAIHNRCIIYLNGFYEHHLLRVKHFRSIFIKKTTNHYHWPDFGVNGPMKKQGETRNTFSIVTTKGNKMLAKIHIKPKLEGPRMPVILSQELEDKWLNPNEDELDMKSVQELIKEYPDEELDAYTVRKLRG
ncbi:MAG: SOS response-associated peptidase family protein [Flavobacteriaceae bacterium]|nr:SOS response-associated peptidase family protein [Flavobacteriaceae bacterium]